MPAIFDEYACTGTYRSARMIEIEDFRVSSNDTKMKEQPKYTLDELLEQCVPGEWSTEEDSAWLDAAPVGGEI
jgi:hypothetical protein